VRFSILMRSLRAVEDVPSDDPDTERPEPPFENRPVARQIRIPVQYARRAVASTAVLTNLRFFDNNAPRGLTAEPF